MSVCANCGGPREIKSRDYKGFEGGARIDRGSWLAHLEADPFCSAECCRAAHSVKESREVVGPSTCCDCHAELPAQRNSLAGPRCRPCSDKARKKRRYTDRGVCAGCGCSVDERTPSCTHCSGRWRRRERRLNEPGYRELENARTRESRALKSAACSPVQDTRDAVTATPGGGILSTREAATAARRAA